ncbi:MAG: radical SAM protein [Nitrospirae bacterium RBG_16_64_22]|nr:MAG: radical SAM protein [Nitrospirae bacterium RBG_16_64_22]
METRIRPPRGRGTGINPPNRFRQQVRAGEVEADDEAPSPATRFIPDRTKSIISRNTSPDLPYRASVNPYRGCEHGCPYCYARAYHEYLDLSAGLDFETTIMVKENAPELLRRELSRSSWKPQVIAMSGVTDPYQPIERKLGITRRCLEVLAEFRNPVSISTKNALVSRDADLLAGLAQDDAAAVTFSITTLDARLTGILEPRASRPEKRLEAIRTLADAGVPVGVLVAPVIPAINDHETSAILEAATGAGASYAFLIPLRLPGAVETIFGDWLERHFPERKEKVLGRLREIHAGCVDDARPGRRFEGTGAYADSLHDLFNVTCRRLGLSDEGPELSAASFRRPEERGQMRLL